MRGALRRLGRLGSFHVYPCTEAGALAAATKYAEAMRVHYPVSRKGSRVVVDGRYVHTFRPNRGLLSKDDLERPGAHADGKSVAHFVKVIAKRKEA